jgi:hypothetical protein
MIFKVTERLRVRSGKVALAGARESGAGISQAAFGHQKAAGTPAAGTQKSR